MATQPLQSDNVPTDTSRFEQIDGHLVERALPNRDHARVQYAITTLLRSQAGIHACEVWQEWTLDESDKSKHNWMTPDVLVASQSAPLAASGHLLPPAILAVEVLSPDQTMAQMRIKALRYFRWGVDSVWIIDPESRSAVTMTASQPGMGEPILEGTLEAGPMQIDLRDIFSFK